MALPILSTTDLTTLGNLVQDLAFTDTCNVLRRGTTSDGQGGKTQSWAITDTVPCSVVETPVTGQEPYRQGGLVSRTQKTILLPRQTDVRDSDRLQAGAVYYEILAVADPTSFEIIRRVYVQRLGQGAV